MKKLKFVTLAFLFFIAIGCSKKDSPMSPAPPPAPILSSTKYITAFSFTKALNATLAADVEANVDIALHTISATVPIGTNVTALVASFSISEKSILKVGTVVQISGKIANNYSAPVTYKITAEDGSSQDYAVNVAFANPQVDVYVAGTIITGLYSKAVYWKNGVSHNLTDGSNYAGASAIAVIGSDVYVAGNEVDPATSNRVVKYWKNGVPTSLTKGALFSEGTSIAIKGSDVYVSGYEYNGRVNVAKLWKNGVETSLTDGTHEAEAYSLAINGNDVYVAGFERNGNEKNVAKYWKNGVPTDLSDGITNAKAKSITVNGNNIFIAGIQQFGGTVYNVAKLWKNGIATSLSDGTYDTDANAVALSGNDVYVAGVEAINGYTGVAKYWKNGISTALTGNSTIASAESIAINGTDIYVAGSRYTGDGIKKLAVVWKNGVAQVLDVSNSGFAYSIVLVH